MVQDEKEVPLPEGVVIDESKVQTESEFTAGNGDSENSLLSAIGKAITPIFEPFGVESNNWPASVSLFTGLLAKEAVIGTMNSLYSMAGPGDVSDDNQLRRESRPTKLDMSEANVQRRETKDESVGNSGEGLPLAPAESVATPSSGDTPQRPIADERRETKDERSDVVAADSAVADSAVAVADSNKVAEPAEAPADGSASSPTEKPLIAGVDECPAEEEEEGGAPDILGAFKEALGTIPENLGAVLGSLTDILGTSGELEAQNAAELKKETLDKVLAAKAITCEEYASIETFSEDEGADKAREEVFAKLAAAGLTLSEDEIGALEEGDLSETADIYANLRSYFHNPDKNGNPVDGFNWQVFAFLIFILLYVPCLAAMGVVVREIGLGLGVLMAVVQTILAWAVAVLLYQIPVGGNVFWIVCSIIVLVATFVFLKLFGMDANKKRRFED
jgi:ferrous iron transport protein B